MSEGPTEYLLFGNVWNPFHFVNDENRLYKIGSFDKDFEIFQCVLIILTG